VEALERPLPKAAFKVGESTVAVGGYYFQEILGLREYLERTQILKLGLRYFFPRTAEGFESRPELGPSQYRRSYLGDFPVTEWQLDRGQLEQDLRGMVEERDIELLEGQRVVELELASAEATACHRVHTERVSGGTRSVLRARWFVDAMSRRFFLRRKLALGRPSAGPAHSAVWFRVPAKIDPERFVGSEQVAWHARVPGNHPEDPSYGRVNSTNHLVGRGYWVWLIPVGSDTTSVGVVAREDLTSIAELRNFEETLAWLRRNEPEVAAAVCDLQPLDFKRLRNYTHTSTRVLSAARWGMTGEAGCFIDPLYSPGSDAIAFMNSLLCEAIELDLGGELEPALAEQLSQEFISWSEVTTRAIQAGYPLFGQAGAGGAKLIWDFAFAQLITQPLFFQMRLKRGYARARLGQSTPSPALTQLRESLGTLNEQVLQMLHLWAAAPGRGLSFEFIEALDDNPATLGRMGPIASGAEPLAWASAGLDRLRGLAAALFLLAVRDVAPAQLEVAESAPFIDPTAFALDPKHWEARGTLRAGVPREEFLPLWHELKQRFRALGRTVSASASSDLASRATLR
jgi:flavin-dependent dehydrogenase